MEDLLFEDYLDYSRQKTLERFELTFIDPMEIGLTEKFQFENLLAEYRTVTTLENTYYY